MPIVEMHPDAQKRPYLHGGMYGPGQTNQAECQVVDYQFPADETPGWDQEDKENVEDWSFIRIRVKQNGGPTCDIFHHEPIGANSGSKLGAWLTGMGVAVEGDTFRHDTDQVVGLMCGVEVGDEQASKKNTGDPTTDRFYTGRLLQVFGV
jgi:hypothetical protein